MSMAEPLPRVVFNIIPLHPVFADIAETLCHGLQELGAQAQVSGAVAQPALNIVFGAHQLADWSPLAPETTVIFNLEQLGAGAEVVSQAYLDQMRRYVVWDYSQRNIDWLRQSGINPAAEWVPLGYAPSLERVPAGVAQDIDVLFYGTVNERRGRILDGLRGRGLNVVSLHQAPQFKADLDGYIARAKVVLNLHFYETHIFEIVRVSYLLTNRKAVVAEVNPNTEIDPDLRRAVAAVPYQGLVEACHALVLNESARHRLEQTGYEIFSARPQAALLREPLARLFQRG
ncbi:MAG TPA: hypothetical protein VI279_12015 [Rhodocyclaceae bacterium]